MKYNMIVANFNMLPINFTTRQNICDSQQKLSNDSEHFNLNKTMKYLVD